MSVVLFLSLALQRLCQNLTSHLATSGLEYWRNGISRIINIHLSIAQSFFMNRNLCCVKHFVKSMMCWSVLIWLAHGCHLGRGLSAIKCYHLKNRPIGVYAHWFTFKRPLLPHLAFTRWSLQTLQRLNDLNLYQYYVFVNNVFSVCLLFQLGSHSSAGTAPTAPPRRATWRPTSSVSTASPLTTASTPIVASDAHIHPRGPPDCLRASREIIVQQEGTRSAWHHCVGLDVVMATADTDSYDYCFRFTSKGLGWLRLLKKRS